MLQQLQGKPNGKSRARFPDIVADAKALGISRVTLWRYLAGRWPWPPLTKARYEVIQRKKRKRNGRKSS